VTEARAASTRADALAALVKIYAPQLPSVPRGAKSKIADELRRNERGAATIGAFGGAAATLKPTRSFGSDI